MNKEQLSSNEHSLSEGFRTSSGNEDFLLMITCLSSLHLTGLNFLALNYFKAPIRNHHSGDILSKIIHPEDQDQFFRYLRSGRQMSEEEEREIVLRIRSPFGYWKKFHLKSRLYQGAEKKGKFMISLGTPLDPARGRFRKYAVTDLETEKNLQYSLNRYKVLVNSLDKGYAIVEMILDPEGKPRDYLFVEVNPAFEKHTRIHAPLGRSINEILQKNEPSWSETFSQVARTGKSLRFESYSRPHQTWFDIYAFPIGRKKTPKVAVLFSDITTRKEAEIELKQLNDNLEATVQKRTEELEETNQLLQMVFDTTSQGIFILSPRFGSNYDIVDFNYVRINRKIRRYYRQEMIGRSFLELNPQIRGTSTFEYLKRTLLTGKSFEFEVPFVQEGKKNWFRVNIRRQRGLVFGSLKNITRKKEQAQKLQDNIRFKKQLIETSPDVILIVDLYTEKIRYLNKDISPHPFMKKDKIRNLSLKEILPLIHPQDRKRAIDFHRNLMLARDKDICELEFRMRGSDRAWDFFGARGKTFRRNKKGNVCEYIMLLRNIQEQKQTQQALIQAEKLSIKGEIARSLAHELRNPLASIGMSADILKTRTAKSPELESLNSYVEIIKRSTSTLNKLVTDLLNVSNYAPLALRKCCLADATDRALELAKDRIYLAGVKVKHNYKGPVYILGDINRLEIALLNIIVNASEAMLPDQGILEIGIEQKEENYQLRISDNGCGMEQAQLDQLFDSFYTQKPEGMGIGLSSVKNILEEHAASVEVQSEPNKGTTFLLYFPCFEK